MPRSALFIGNGINNITNSKSWEQLLISITEYLGIESQINNIRTKPFPLLYEEIFLRGLAGKKIPEKELKKFISSLVQEIKPNEVHQRIAESNFEDILTTNYEYTLETCYGYKNIKNTGYIQEKIYSVFRHNTYGSIRIWHVHGECNAPQSITLGYEHYGVSCNKCTTMWLPERTILLKGKVFFHLSEDWSIQMFLFIHG